MTAAVHLRRSRSCDLISVVAGRRSDFCQRWTSRANGTAGESLGTGLVVDLSRSFREMGSRYSHCKQPNAANWFVTMLNRSSTSPTWVAYLPNS